MEEKVKHGAPEVLLTARQVAERLGVKPCTVRKLIERNQINVVKVESLNRFTEADVAEYIKKNRR